MASPLLTLSFLVPCMSNVAKTDNPRNVMVSTCLRAILIKMHEKSKELLKQDSFHSSAVFSFHFLLLPIGNPLHRDLSCNEALCLLISLLVSAFFSTSLCTHLLIIWKKIKSTIKFTRRIRMFGSEFIQLRRHDHIGDSCENHKQGNGISESVLETRLPSFPSLSKSLRHFSVTRSWVFYKTIPPASYHSFCLALI